MENKGLEELKRLAYENACCRCQYYIDNKCTNKGECVWKTIEQELKRKENLAAMCDRLAKLLGLKEQDYLELETLITKKLKALEIIKNYGYFDEQGDLIIHLPTNRKEEYDLLKEALL